MSYLQNYPSNKVLNLTTKHMIFLSVRRFTRSNFYFVGISIVWKNFVMYLCLTYWKVQLDWLESELISKMVVLKLCQSKVPAFMMLTDNSEFLLLSRLSLFLFTYTYFYQPSFTARSESDYIRCFDNNCIMLP